MQILAEKQHVMGGTYVLVDYGNNFYAYGFEEDLHCFTGFPVDQCGSKQEVSDHCKSISKLCKEYIEKFRKELLKLKNPKGWELLIENEKSHLDALTEFQNILNAI